MFVFVIVIVIVIVIVTVFVIVVVRDVVQCAVGHGQVDLVAVLVDRVSKDTDRDFIMSGQEAKDYGIVDEILTNRELAAVPSAEGTS